MLILDLPLGIFSGVEREGLAGRIRALALAAPADILLPGLLHALVVLGPAEPTAHRAINAAITARTKGASNG